MMVICRHWAWLVPLLLLTEVTPFPTEQTSDCQSANIYADNCYDVVSEPLAYNAARGQCILRGGRLAKISDSEVNSFLASICDEQVTPTVYIGLDDQETEGSFEWSDGTIADNYTNWAIDGTGGNQATSRDCVLYDVMTSTWSTRDCNKPAPYVCEYGDFELVPLDGVWTSWRSSYNSLYPGDNELLATVRQTYPDTCPSPYDVECRTSGSNVAWNETGDVLAVPCSANQGLLCVDDDQSGGECQDYELRFFCPPGVNECDDSASCPDPNAECIDTHGGYNCRCKGGYYMYDQTCIASLPCTGWGDPHYTTYDRRTFHFQGTCDYLLSTPCDNTTTNDLPYFRVLAQNEFQSEAQRNRGVSVTKTILVEVYGYMIQIRQLGRVTSSGVEQTLPLRYNDATRPGSFVHVRKLVDGVELTTDFGLYVLFDGNHRFRITIPETYSTLLCGLCGDYDGNKHNDFQLPDGSTSTDVNEFGNSWKDEELSNMECEDGLTPNPECQTTEEQTTVNQRCGVITDPDGPFLLCHALVTPHDFEYGCRFDLCNDIENGDLLCKAIEAYAAECEALGVFVSWRSDELCPPTCMPNGYFADSVSSCPSTCNDPDAAVNCDLPNVSGCVCYPGHILSGDTCVPYDMCGCVEEDGSYHMLNEAWFDGNCNTVCECMDEGATVCYDDATCHVDGACISLPGDEHTCVCNPGYGGHPQNCTDVNECVEEIHYCHDGADCINTDGSYECQCREGFVGDGKDCEDVDECVTSPCHVYATCVNEPGSYRCFCSSGYTGDGEYCQDILDPDLGDVNSNETNGCSFYMEYCSDMASCVDLPDEQFMCQCPDGAYGDGFKNGTGCQYPPCIEGMIEHGFDCYQFIDDPESFPDARKKCQNLGGELASVTNPVSLSFLQEYAANNDVNGSFWIGYTDALWDGTFVWLDGSVTDYKNWAVNEPVNTYGRDCVFVDLGPEANHVFHTRDCNTPTEFICEQSRIPLGCPAGWSLAVDGSCLTSFDEPMTYFEAYMTCVANGADLVSANSTDQLDELREIVSGSGKSNWIGLNDGFYNSLDGIFEWTDGMTDTVIVATNMTSMSCVLLDHTIGEYTATSCDHTHEFLCRREYGVHHVCPQGSMRFQDKCYKLKPDTYTPQPDAWATCTNMGGDLVSIGTEAEQKFITEFILKRNVSADYWIGLEEHAPEGNYSWSDGTILEYRNWGLVQPDDTDPYNCVRLHSSEGYAWDDTSCELQLPSICEYYNTPCQLSADCNADGQCNMGQCRCKSGFIGDGKNICTDLDECDLHDPCDEHATCINTMGSYTCTCIEGYTGSGLACINLLACEGDADCHTNGYCNTTRMCECKIGYEGDGKATCINVDECTLSSHDCHADAHCYDTDGYFDCVCKDGFTGNGRECQDTPTSCQYIKDREPASTSGLYVIDPDGPGGVSEFTVECDMRSDIGVTVLPHDRTHKMKITYHAEVHSYVKVLTYTYGTADQIQALIQISPFCYQEMTYQCSNGAPLQGYYEDSQGVNRNRWGGATTDGQCQCGEIGSCTNVISSCNCDGSVMGTDYDYGKLTDKSQLPITKLVLGGISGSMVAYHTISPMYCGPKQFDIPQNCDEARWNYIINFNTPVLIDPDGSGGDTEGNLAPFVAQCDMMSHPHVGVTQIPHSIVGHQVPTSPGVFTLEYSVQMVHILKLIQLSGFCTQDVEYICQNSRITGGGEVFASVTQANGSMLGYWPGGFKQPNMCGCGITKSCDDPSVACNCDITDGVVRRDFGSVIHKEDLPLTSISVNDVGTGKVANYSIGRLQCAPTQFGIPASCQEHRYLEHTYSYAYLVDPDGPSYPQTAYNREIWWKENAYKPDHYSTSTVEGNYDLSTADLHMSNKNEFYSTNVAPFPVHCEFPPDDIIGITIMPHTGPDAFDISNDDPIPVEYSNVDRLQISKLITRSAYCSQTIQYDCVMSSLHNPDSYWESRWDNSASGNRFYFDGTSGAKCACGNSATCVGNTACNCDIRDIQQRSDSGLLHNKEDLPVTGVRIMDIGGSGSSGSLTLGPLKCYETFPTCYALYTHGYTVLGQYDDRHEVSYFVVDPDDIFGVEPFHVGCEFPLKTIIYPDYGHVTIGDTPAYEGPHATCTDFTYQFANHLQIQALVDASGFCMQYMSYSAKYSPLSTHGYWVSHQGQQMSGWAGSADGNECACGMTDSCDEGPDVSCNSDNDDHILRQDHGLLINKSHLPVSNICAGFSNTTAAPGATKTIKLQVDEMYCGPHQFDIQMNCQMLRNTRHTATETWIIDPDGFTGEKPFPAYCEMTNDPPLGVTVITHTKSECETLSNEQTDIDITYNAINTAQLHALTGGSVYCKQHMTYQCTDAGLDLAGLSGWYSLDENCVSYWAGNTGGVGCDGSDCNCNVAQTGESSSDGGWLYNKDDLPVSRVSVAAVTSVNASRCLDVQPLRCYTVYKHCHEIKQNGATYNPNGNQRYAIDPDDAPGVDVMGVTCDFNTDNRIGISVIPHDNEYTQGISESEPGSNTEEIIYRAADTRQIQELTRVSPYCSQELYYSCRNLPLINDADPLYSYFKTWDGLVSHSWAGADIAGTTGCACVLLDTCPTNHTCHCDSLTSDLVTEGGVVTNKDLLPVSEVVYGGSEGASTEGYYDIGSVRCAPTPFDLPKDCEEARTRGQQTGEILIWPSEDLDPFLVYCDMEMVPYHGVTIIKPTLAPSTPTETSLLLEYREASIDQVRALVLQSSACYFPVKLNCYATQYLGGGDSNGFFGGDDAFHPYINGNSGDECTCGTVNKCGGHDGRDAMTVRSCNCDVQDYSWRIDVGFIQSVAHLPVKQFVFNLGDSSNKSAYISVDQLYCADATFDLNECSMGYHDCHKWADCSNTNGAGTFTCSCHLGYQGLGLEGVWANGRECYDDDECALNVCPYEADCENTVGSFICHCKTGFRKIAETECQDIDECSEGTDSCDVNAICYNTHGSFHCSCKDGYRGDGQSCEEIGQCKCWGDPHCVSFDRKFLHFQGACQYVLARDGCINHVPTTDPSFQVIQKTWREYETHAGEVSWTKEVYVLLHGYNITLGQKKSVYVDGMKALRLPRQPDPEHHPDLTITTIGIYVYLQTGIGFEVYWDGETKVEIIISPQYKNMTCGLCGDYNGVIEDDWTVGPQCPASDQLPGEVTENNNLFGNSWFYEGEDGSTCGHDCSLLPNTGECPEDIQAEVETMCQSLIDPQGRFGACISVMDELEISMRYESCMIDACSSEDDIDLGICANAKELASRCHELVDNELFDSGNWRSPDFCPFTCPTGMLYTTCADPCQPTCNQTESTTCEVFTCVEGCVCPANMVLDGDTCITVDQCGCAHNGNYYSVGDRIVRPDCTEECFCPGPLMALSCELLVCHTDGPCDLRDGLYDCFCNVGYAGDGKQCDDIDECDPEAHPCNTNAACHNTIGSFVCTCDLGFQGDGFTCEDVDECLIGTDNCDEHAKCSNIIGSYECHCISGYRKLNNGSNICEDVDECVTNRNDCDRKTTVCDNTEGSYDCLCKAGYEHLDDLRCQDIDECLDDALNDCHDDATCYNNLGGYTCVCNTGYRGSNGTFCEDLDECSNPDYNECHEKANCSNTVGSYLCACIDGYTGDGLTCSDKNECAEGVEDCTLPGDGGKCVNTPGSYHCGCQAGFTGDGLIDGESCEDIDECVVVLPAICGTNSICTNFAGSYLCNCTSDDYYSPTDSGTNCQEKDTCDDPDFVCSSVEVCLEGPHGAYCQCQTGYIRPTPEGICTDVNECLETPDPCITVTNTECANTAGSYSCECVDGYSKNPDTHQCEDMDECDLDLDLCDTIKEICLNDIGEYHCDCATGFFLQQETDICEDINECESAGRCNCDVNADCFNTPGGCTCQCHEGFTGDGMKCDDISECDVSNDLCSHNADCYEIGGSYNCTCHDGYRGDGHTCENIDECSELLHDCHNNAVCMDTAGGYFCQCLDGYQGHCDECLDVNECETDTHSCSDYADCSNTPGSYICECKEGYLGDGHQCNDLDECILGLYTTCGDHAECWNIAGGFECHCFAGYHQTLNKTCEDDDECGSSHNICHLHAMCNNTEGSYKCTCLEGFVGDGVTCEPNDPQQCGDVRCDLNAICLLNVDDDWTCQCLSGYEGIGYIQSGQPGCSVKNPCSTSPCDGNANCIAFGSYPVCICQDGFLGDGFYCQEVSPCDDPFTCGLGAECVETDVNSEGYVCQCQTGYSLVAQYQCEDNNECDDGSAMCGADMVCVNTHGSYTCVCQLGYTEDINTNSCTDVDECVAGTHDCSGDGRATCTNTDGGYICQCITPQYTGDGKTCLEVNEPGCTLECGDNMYCKNRGVPAPTCVCVTGTVLVGELCLDENECDGLISQCSEHASCINTSPGYACTCDAGYIGSGVYCQDLDECVYDSDCDLNAVCENTEGSYTCTCNYGYQGDGMDCSPIPPEVDICGCGINGICDSVRDLCQCKDGYVLMSSLNEDKCQDENECEKSGSCHPAAICENLVGGYSCSCPSHMTGDGLYYCDENECITGNNLCSLQGNCTDLVGGYLCACAEGYKGDGFTCIPVVDPCLDTDLECGDNGQCISLLGLATCKCDAGYMGDGEQCSDLNECDATNPQHDCHEHAICVNYDGGYYCQCREGFRGNGKETCQDLDECDEDIHGCSVNAFCRNNIGSYECICQPGMTGNGFTCLPAAGCDENGYGCHTNASCISNSIGGYQCHCHEGFVGDGFLCADEDECSDGTDNCEENASCTNIDGSYLCQCLEGFEGSGYICHDVNECWYPDDNDCDVTAKCENTEGSYTCTCLQGYNMAANGTCTDVDECTNGAVTVCSEQATCDNTLGSYTCSCVDGYYGNGITCEDINECALGLANCESSTLCSNTPGSFTCGCLAGYLDVNDTCTDNDECQDPALNECTELAECTNTNGGYFCQCAEGYDGNGIICVRPNPCDVPGVCLEHAVCVNLGDSYECVCPPPTTGDGITLACFAPDECSEGTDDCDPNALCTDTFAGYECACLPGFTGDGKVCTDLDECDLTKPGGGGHNCDVANGMECVNNPSGGFSCVCGQELLENGGCSGPNHCLGETSCDVNADCINRWDGVTCRCKDGYIGDGQTCTDVDECVEGMFFCAIGSECENTLGDYLCRCLDGYQLVEGRCRDINECAEDTDNCAEEAMCVNIWGSFICTCRPGYTGNGLVCDDIDECTDELDPCHPHALCTNTVGTCICTCENGYTGDGIFCEMVDQCPGEADVHCANGSYCVMGANQGADYTCNCQEGYQGDGYEICSGGVCTQVCTDINECAFSPDTCHVFATCENTEGYYECRCKPGMVGNGLHCEDVDECATGTNSCDEYAECTNNFGSYECVCRAGYVGDGHVCQQIDECITGDNECDQAADCQDMDGTYRCQCVSGYHGDGKECQDIDECLDEIDDCHHLATCINRPGTYACLCIAGYTGNGTHCTDIDECEEGFDSCLMYAECFNTPGSSICRCPAGFIDNDGECIDINECIVESKDAECDEDDAVCINQPGSYSCQCEAGYEYGADGKCHDINECAVGVPESGGICGSGGICQNTDGSCLCACQPGYHTPEGTTCGGCTDIDECTSTISPHDCGILERCENIEGGFECVCKEGYTGTAPDCTDVNECELGLDVCGPGSCENTVGSYVCLCPEGYVFVAGTCTNVNECTLPSTHIDVHQCINAICEDYEGSYGCVCKTGYQRKSALECVDKDECDTPNMCQPNGTCVNLPGSFVCDCLPGYQASGQRCVDLDECTDMPTLCGDVKSSICINVEGSYSCLCRDGYYWLNGRCQDLDECVQTPGMCGNDSVCINMAGTYSCNCPEGFISENGLCVNIDECTMAHSCDHNAVCTDTTGSYTCQCKTGYHGNGRFCEPICKPDTCPSQQTCLVFENKPQCVCMCRGVDCLNEGEVCGTDGTTYESNRELQMTNCLTGIDVRRSYRGRCKGTCAEVQCSFGKTCEVLEDIPQCICAPCTEAEEQSGSICTTLGETYPSMCVFRMLQCSLERNDTFSHLGPCEIPRDCVYTEWSGWSPCSVTCNEGHRLRSRDVAEYPLNDGATCQEPLVQADSCYATHCPGDMCEHHSCTRPAEYCVVNVQTNLPQCQCPDCTHEPKNKICGLIISLTKTRTITAYNLCTLEHYACVANNPYVVLHDGACLDDQPNDPVECTMMPHINAVHDHTDNCTSSRHVRTNRCAGGCGQQTGECCLPINYEYHNQEFDCGQSPRKVIEIKACGCVSDEQGEAPPTILPVHSAK